MIAHCTGSFRVNGKVIAPPQTTTVASGANNRIESVLDVWRRALRARNLGTGNAVVRVSHPLRPPFGLRTYRRYSEEALSILEKCVTYI
jgi:hypothetical protein